MVIFTLCVPVVVAVILGVIYGNKVGLIIKSKDKNATYVGYIPEPVGSPAVLLIRVSNLPLRVVRFLLISIIKEGLSWTYRDRFLHIAKVCNHLGYRRGITHIKTGGRKNATCQPMSLSYDENRKTSY